MSCNARATRAERLLRTAAFARRLNLQVLQLILQHSKTHCNTHYNTYCNVLQHDATHVCCARRVLAPHHWRDVWMCRCVAMWCTCVAVCCSVLQGGANVLQCSANVLQCVAVCCNVLQCVAMWCKCVAVCCSVLQCNVLALNRRTGVTCESLGTATHTATHHNTLQHILQHIATHVCCTCRARLLHAAALATSEGAGVLQCVAVCCNVLQCVEVRCSALHLCEHVSV